MGISSISNHIEDEFIKLTQNKLSRFIVKKIEFLLPFEYFLANFVF